MLLPLPVAIQVPVIPEWTLIMECFFQRDLSAFYYILVVAYVRRNHEAVKLIVSRTDDRSSACASMHK